MAETCDKLRSHICDGESQLVELDGMCSAAMVLGEHILNKEGSSTACEGLFAVIVDIVDRTRDLHSWWNQLHDLAVAARRQADG